MSELGSNSVRVRHRSSRSAFYLPDSYPLGKCPWHVAPGRGSVKIAAAIAIAAAGLGGGIAYKKFREYLREKKLPQQREEWRQKHSICPFTEYLSHFGMSKGLHTLPAVFTREASRFWTSCSQKVLKYSAKIRGVRCAGYFGTNSSLHRPCYEDTTTDCQSVTEREAELSPVRLVKSLF